MTPGDVDELRVTARGPDRQGVANRPDGETDEPEAEAQTDRPGERAVDDGEAARRAAEQDRFGERPVRSTKLFSNSLGSTPVFERPS